MLKKTALMVCVIGMGCKSWDGCDAGEPELRLVRQGELSLRADDDIYPEWGMQGTTHLPLEVLAGGFEPDVEIIVEMDLQMDTWSREMGFERHEETIRTPLFLSCEEDGWAHSEVTMFVPWTVYEAVGMNFAEPIEATLDIRFRYAGRSGAFLEDQLTLWVAL